MTGMVAPEGEPLDLTFVIVAFNEEEGLPATIEDCNAWMERSGRVARILIMNDGSTDGTRHVADEAAQRFEHITAYHAPENMGQFPLLRTSWGLIETTYYTVVPGDNQFDMRSFDLFLPHIGRFDVIFGFPNNEEIRGQWRMTLSFVWRMYLMALFGVAVTYLGGLVVLPVDLVRRIETESEGFLGWYETAIRLCLSGATFIQVPFVMRDREGGETKAYNPTRNAVDVVKMLRLWTKIKGPGALPAGEQWSRIRKPYEDYRAANTTPATFQGDVLKIARPPATAYERLVSKTFVDDSDE